MKRPARPLVVVALGGNALLLQNEAAADRTPPMPLDHCVAETQGALGHLLQQALFNRLRAEGLRRTVATLVTHVEVDPDDPAFTVGVAKALLESGEFPPGSMGPKIEAAVKFLEGGGEHVLVTNAESLEAALDRRAGTWIGPDRAERYAVRELFQ